jgi:hypothetical protein
MSQSIIDRIDDRHQWPNIGLAVIARSIVLFGSGGNSMAGYCRDYISVNVFVPQRVSSSSVLNE